MNMQFVFGTFARTRTGVLLIGAGLLLVGLQPSASAQSTQRGERRSKSAKQTTKPSTPATKADDEAVETIDVLTGIRTGQLSGAAEGIGDGRVTMSLKNLTTKRLRVILPPGLVLSSATGQFGGGMGGGGMGGGMGGGGMGGGGMGGMGGGGMGGGGMGGMGGGGMGGGGMGGGGGSAGTMPASMGMMMLGNLIMRIVGDADSWDRSSLMSGGMGGGGMGGMGGGGMGGGGMGGMGGGGMGGMGGGFRSVPPSGPLNTTLAPGQQRNLPTVVVSLGSVDRTSERFLPAKGEALQIGGIETWTQDVRLQSALKRLAEGVVPQTIAQMVIWNVAHGADWDQVARAANGWANASELALAQRLVAVLGTTEKAGASEPGVLYFDFKTQNASDQALADELKTLWTKNQVVGLTARAGIPTRPASPALACKVEVGTSNIELRLFLSQPAGENWVPLGAVKVKRSDLLIARVEDKKNDDSGVSSAAQLGDALAAKMLESLVRVQLTKVAGKDAYTIKIVNGTPFILNGIAVGGSQMSKDGVPAMLSGMSLAPLKNITLPATADVVERLQLKSGIKVLAADLSGL